MHQVISIPKFICRLYLKVLDNVYKYPKKELGLADSNVSNKWYKSGRSVMHYIYLQTPLILFLNKCIELYIFYKTGIEFDGITRKCAPINFYKRGGFIKLHRDRNMETDREVHFIATLILLPSLSGGHFCYYEPQYIRKVENNGKDVFLTENAKKVLIPLKQGQIIILRNDITAHEVTECQTPRYSLTFRTNS